MLTQGLGKPEELEFPAALVGSKLIGKGGGIIKQLKRDSGATAIEPGDGKVKIYGTGVATHAL